MANPVRPQAKRTKPVPAIFADPVAEQASATPATATLAVPMATAPVAMVDRDAIAAAIDTSVAAAVDHAADDAAAVAHAAVDASADTTETLAAAAIDVVDAADDVAERNVEAVTAHTQTVSTLAKGPLTMATAFDTTKAQDMMGDLSTHAKGAMEKGVKFTEDLTEFTKGNVQAIVESSRIAAKGMEALAHDAAETAKSGFEQAQTAMKSFAQVKSPTELFQLQSDYARTAFDQLVANASKASEQMMKFMGDVAQPLSNRYALASEKVKSAAL